MSQRTAESSKDKPGVTIAPVIRSHNARTTRVVTVRCPLCSGKHYHGFPYGESAVGPRQSHCGRGPYLVVAT